MCKVYVPTGANVIPNSGFSNECDPSSTHRQRIIKRLFIHLSVKIVLCGFIWNDEEGFRTRLVEVYVVFAGDAVNRRLTTAVAAIPLLVSKFAY